MEPDLLNVGRVLGREQDRQLQGALDLVGGRARLLAALGPRRARFGVRAQLAAAAAVLVLIGGLALREESGERLAFRVGTSAEPGRIGELLRASPERDLKVVFSDGSEVTLFGEATASVAEADRRGAALVVERGGLRVNVVPRRDSRWRVEMGPFRVEVTGTRFETNWHADVRRFTLTLREGSVVVSGPVVGTKRAVAAGETLSVLCATNELRLTRDGGELAAQPTSSGISGGGVPSAVPAVRIEDRLDVPALSQRVKEAEPAVTFRALVRANEYERALEAAEREGFEGLCKTAPASDLMVLGDAARLAGRGARAEQAYRAVRERFPGSAAARAGFMLGRLAFDERGAHAEAARYFAVSLLEEPRGPFAREAAGRLVEALDRSGDASGARAAAERYLERYPGGPHANLAKVLLERR